MSEQDVFMVATVFGDVAELGQGYVNRADGERILVPLPTACEVGDGVRFIVHLGDGTPAFAGAGRCVQVSDQGEGAPAEERFETLLDSLAFDERSRPVYDYIVAVRQAVYAAGGPDAAEGGAQQAATEAAEEAAEEAAQEAADEGAAEQDEAAAEDAYAAEAEGEPEVLETVEVEASVSVEESYEAAAEVDEADEAEAEPTRILSGEEDVLSYVERVESVAPPRQASEAPIAMPSAAPIRLAPEEREAAPNVDLAAFVIPALPSGMLQRPTVSTHWQPATPRFPQASARSGLFRYDAGALPVPQVPPRPAMNASARVSRAPAPPN